MRASFRMLAGLLAAGLVGLSSSASLAGAWKFGQDPRGNNELQYLEDGNATFYAGCGRALGLHVHYPGKARNSGPASITIASGKSSMAFKGEFEETSDTMATEFLQWTSASADPIPRSSANAGRRS